MNPKIIKGSWKDKDPEVMAAQHAPFIFINGNGSKWAGQEEDDMSVLYDVLGKYQLRPDFGEISLNPCVGVNNPKSRHGKDEPQYIDGPRIFDADGVVYFSGNFVALSHGFSIYTNDLETILKMTALMQVNTSTQWDFEE